MTKQDVFTILAIIGALVVAGAVLRLSLALLGPLGLIALGVVVYLMVRRNKRLGGPK